MSVFLQLPEVQTRDMLASQPVRAVLYLIATLSSSFVAEKLGKFQVHLLLAPGCMSHIYVVDLLGQKLELETVTNQNETVDEIVRVAGSSHSGHDEGDGECGAKKADSHGSIVQELLTVYTARERSIVDG